MAEIRAASVLPARREEITLHTSDGLELVGELALPPERSPVATLVCLHPLPTAAGMMDSHVLRKASYRLPALADLAVLRFNTRGRRRRAARARASSATGRPSGSTWQRRWSTPSTTTCRARGCWAGRSARSWRCGGDATRWWRA